MYYARHANYVQDIQMSITWKNEMVLMDGCFDTHMGLMHSRFITQDILR